MRNLQGCQVKGHEHGVDLDAAYLYLGQGRRRVVGEPADPLASVAVVEGVAPVGSREAQVSAGLHGGDILHSKGHSNDKSMMMHTLLAAFKNICSPKMACIFAFKRF